MALIIDGVGRMVRPNEISETELEAESGVIDDPSCSA